MATATDEFVHDEQEQSSAGRGLITRPQNDRNTPALMAEQQRAKSEIEAALTIAAARPRDEAECLDRILTSCQRTGVATEAEYEYSRGGTNITGPTVKLLELVAQQWGNLEFGFRELARYPGDGGQAGESVVEAFAWDLQSNTRRKVQFTVRHIRDKKGGGSVLRDERDIYELIANHAQRRVRTCLENIIPRDIVDSATEECRKTMLSNEKVTPEKLHKLTDAFAGYGITKDQIEARLQRKLETMSPAQMVRLRNIFTSLKDGMAEPKDFFDVAESESPATVADAAKATLRKRQAAKQEPHAEPQQAPGEVPYEDPLAQLRESLTKADDHKIQDLQDELQSDPDIADEIKEQGVQLCIDERKRREKKGNKQKSLTE